MISEEFLENVEGNTRLLVPAASLNKKIPPKTPAFFNPAAKLNRDISVLIYKTFISEFKEHAKSFADAFSGIGARALRVAVEVPGIPVEVACTVRVAEGVPVVCAVAFGVVVGCGLEPDSLTITPSLSPALFAWYGLAMGKSSEEVPPPITALPDWSIMIAWPESSPLKFGRE